MSCKWTKDSGRLATCFLLLELVLVLYRADSSDSKVLLTSRWSEKWLRESQSLRGYSVLCTGKKSTEMSFRNLENRGSKSWEENSERKRFLAVRLPHRAESSAAAALAASLASKPALSLSTLLLCTIVFVVKKPPLLTAYHRVKRLCCLWVAAQAFYTVLYDLELRHDLWVLMCLTAALLCVSEKSQQFKARLQKKPAGVSELIFIEVLKGSRGPLNDLSNSIKKEWMKCGECETCSIWFNFS